MKKIFILLASIIATTQVSAQAKQSKNPSKKISTTTNTDEGYDIKLTMTPVKNQKAFLACYYGQGKALIDSCMLDDKSTGHFKGTKKLVGGIYFVVNQNYSIQEENVIIGDKQNFSIIGDTTKKNQFEFVGNPENELFKLYAKKTEELGKKLKEVEDKFKDAKTKADTVALQKEYKLKNADLIKYQADFAAEHPTSFMSVLLTAMKRPEYPEVKEGDSLGQINAFRYMREHYLDDMDFADARLLRTPFFEKKVDEYFKYYVPNDADSIYPEVKYVLLSARESKEMYAYLLTKFTNKYINPEFMGQDKVFVNLFKDYYLTGDTVLLDTKSRKTIIDRGYSLMLALVGNIASPLDLTDSSGKVISLYSIKSKYTVVAYWSPSCGHCRTELPILDSIYKAKWKKLDLKVYSIISKDDELAEMKKFIKEKEFTKDWFYTYETRAAKEATEKAGQPNFRQAYDLNKTPILYLLDQDKKILAKGLSINQIDDLITRRNKSGK
jgi:thiol-disulfide isomerase/thioredoxin